MKLIHGVVYAAGLLAADMVVAQTSERLQPDFTFRSVTVPQTGTSRITVQIDPTAASAIRAPDSHYDDDESVIDDIVQAAAAPETTTTAAPNGYEWFWASISPRREDSRPGRLAEAIAVLADPPQGNGVASPRVQGMQDIADIYGTDILRATIGTDVSPALVLAVISIESGGQIEALSGAGASGLMQLMPATAERFGVTDRNDPTQNIAGGVAYLDWLLGHFDGDPILALAGYNAGEGAVRDNGGVPPYAETRGYVPKVLAAWSVARGLCQTPPELISDGCVFAINNL